MQSSIFGIIGEYFRIIGEYFILISTYCDKLLTSEHMMMSHCEFTSMLSIMLGMMSEKLE